MNGGCCAGCQRGYDGCNAFEPAWGLAGLLGAIPQNLGEMAGGNYFEFGYNAGIIDTVFKLYDPSEIERLLQEELGLSYTTHVYKAAGVVNPYIVVTGYATTSYPSATVFAEEIYQAIKNAGYPIDYSTIQFRFAPYGTAPGSQLQGTPYTNQAANQNQNQPPAQCDFSAMGLGDYFACLFGIKSPIGGLAAGTVGGLIVGGVGLLVVLALVKK